MACHFGLFTTYKQASNELITQIYRDDMACQNGKLICKDEL